MSGKHFNQLKNVYGNYKLSRAEIYAKHHCAHLSATCKLEADAEAFAVFKTEENGRKSTLFDQFHDPRMYLWLERGQWISRMSHIKRVDDCIDTFCVFHFLDFCTIEIPGRPLSKAAILKSMPYLLHKTQRPGKRPKRSTSTFLSESFKLLYFESVTNSTCMHFWAQICWLPQESVTYPRLTESRKIFFQRTTCNFFLCSVARRRFCSRWSGEAAAVAAPMASSVCRSWRNKLSSALMHETICFLPLKQK